MMTMTNSMSNDISKLSNSDLISAKRTIDTEIDALRTMESELGTSLTQALDLMQSARGRVILTGMGKSGHIAQKIAASLASTGTPSFFVHPAEASHGDLGMITPDDIVIAISNSGESKELVDILNYSKRFGIKLIAVTKNPESSLGKAGDVVLKLPGSREACPLGLAPTSSTTATLVLGDILTVAMTKAGISAPFVFWLSAGIVPWFYFSEVLSAGTIVLHEYNYLVKKVVFPINVLPFVKSISSVFVHGFFALFTLIVGLLYGFGITPYILQLIYYFVAMMALVIGLIYLTSALCVFFKDI